jgi:hypothetical protein
MPLFLMVTESGAIEKALIDVEHFQSWKQIDNMLYPLGKGQIDPRD